MAHISNYICDETNIKINILLSKKENHICNIYSNNIVRNKSKFK